MCNKMETNVNKRVTCVANYAYEASEADELTIKPGDVIYDVERLQGGWWRGESQGRRGMFPDNFVTVAIELPNNRTPLPDELGRCRAVFSYQPANPDELPLCVGDVLEVIGEVEEGWWKGRRQGRLGVFPSNFVVMLDQQAMDPPFEPPPDLPLDSQSAPFESAPALPPKPVREQCRVLFPYTGVNDDELTLAEDDIVTIVSKDGPDRGWWRGELYGVVGLFPDNFVELLPVAQETEEKKPDRPPTKTPNLIYPILNKYTEKTNAVKEFVTSKISVHKENMISKETNTQSTVTHTNKSESEKLIHSETVIDGAPDGQVKKPPVPLKKSSTPTSVSGLFSGLKNRMMSSTDKDKSSSSGNNSGGEWDRPDGGAASKPAGHANANTFDHIQRNSILNDPRAGRVKAPRRRPPSQALRDDTLQEIGLSNGHEATEKTERATPEKPTPEKPTPEKATPEKATPEKATPEKPTPEKGEEIKPRTREWEKHKAPWMAELKLNQAKKTGFADGKSRSVSSSSEASGVASKAGGGSTDWLSECGIEEKRSTHSMEMSKSTSSISNRMSVLENFEETKVRQSLDSKTSPPPAYEVTPKPTLHSPTAAGRTLSAMLDDIKKPPVASARPDSTDKSPKAEKTVDSPPNTVKTSTVIEKLERTVKMEEKVPEKVEKSSTLERRLHSLKTTEKSEGLEALVAKLNSRITNLEKLLDVQHAKFSAAIEDLNLKFSIEKEKRQALQSELEKFGHCVTQV